MLYFLKYIYGNHKELIIYIFFYCSIESTSSEDEDNKPISASFTKNCKIKFTKEGYNFVCVCVLIGLSRICSNLKAKMNLTNKFVISVWSILILKFECL